MYTTMYNINYLFWPVLIWKCYCVTSNVYVVHMSEKGGYEAHKPALVSRAS